MTRDEKSLQDFFFSLKATNYLTYESKQFLLQYYTIAKENPAQTRNRNAREEKVKSYQNQVALRPQKMNPRKRQNRCRFFSFHFYCTVQQNSLLQHEKLRVKMRVELKSCTMILSFISPVFSFISSHGSTLRMHAYRRRRKRRLLRAGSPAESRFFSIQSIRREKKRRQKDLKQGEKEY